MAASAAALPSRKHDDRRGRRRNTSTARRGTAGCATSGGRNYRARASVRGAPGFVVRTLWAGALRRGRRAPPADPLPALPGGQLRTANMHGRWTPHVPSMLERIASVRLRRAGAARAAARAYHALLAVLPGRPDVPPPGGARSCRSRLPASCLNAEIRSAQAHAREGATVCGRRERGRLPRLFAARPARPGTAPSSRRPEPRTQSSFNGLSGRVAVRPGDRRTNRIFIDAGTHGIIVCRPPPVRPPPSRR